jgi:hypothetical protein
MGIIKSSTFGEIRGRVGDNVFSRDKSGLTIRRYTSAVQPNSGPQLVNQTGFSASSIAWSSLSASHKTSWAEYASNPSRFNPDKRRTHSPVSGRNAFMSCYISVYNKSSFYYDSLYLEQDETTPMSGTFINYSLPTVAPQFNLSGNMVHSSGAPKGLWVGSYYGYIGPSYLKIQIKSDTRQFTYHGTKDEFENPFGFILYCSEPMAYIGTHPTSPKYMLLSALRPFYLSSGLDFTTSHNFWLFLRFSTSLPGYKIPLAAGQIRKLQLDALSVDGMRKTIGSFWFTF